MSPFKVALRLGRVSNLPTVWSNVLAGIALGGAAIDPAGAALLAGALSLSYVGGMYLNDAFDARWDAEHRAERPIPQGHVSRGVVLAAGAAMLLGGAGLTVAAAPRLDVALAAAGLAAVIVAYDLFHKGNPAAPLLMALCRVGVYACAGLASGGALGWRLFAGAGVLLVYVMALSVVARSETRDPKAPRRVGLLIAGIALLDAGFLLLTWHPLAAGVAAAAFVLTRYWQRSVPGT